MELPSDKNNATDSAEKYDRTEVGVRQNWSFDGVVLAWTEFCLLWDRVLCSPEVNPKLSFSLIHELSEFA